MKSNIFFQKLQVIGGVFVLAIILYLVPGILEDAKDDNSKKAAYVICYCVIFWSIGSTIYKGLIKSDSEESKNVTFSQFMKGDGFVSPRRRALASIALLLLFAYLTPELWQHTNGDITRQVIHIACSLGLLWF